MARHGKSGRSENKMKLPSGALWILTNEQLLKQLDHVNGIILRMVSFAGAEERLMKRFTGSGKLEMVRKAY